MMRSVVILLCVLGLLNVETWAQDSTAIIAAAKTQKKPAKTAAAKTSKKPPAKAVGNNTEGEPAVTVGERLSDEENNRPVNQIVPDSLPLVAGPIPAPPQLPAKAWLLLDYDSGRVLAEHQSATRIEPASLTKMLTIYTIANLLAQQRAQLTDSVAISEKAQSMSGSRMFLETGDQVTLEQVMRGDIIQSGNDASVALAEFAAGTEDSFAVLMNQTALGVGMNGSHFMNSTGLPDANHYTNAQDLAKLATALIREHPDIYAWFAEKSYTYNNIKQENRNRLLWRDAHVDGIKTGHTEAAGYCLVASAKAHNMRLIAVVLGAESEKLRADAAQALLSYGFRFYETRQIYQGGDPLADSPLWKGEKDTVRIGAGETVHITFPRGQHANIKVELERVPQLIAPLDKGTPVGTVRWRLNGETLAQRPLVLMETATAGSMTTRIIDSVKLFFE